MAVRGGEEDELVRAVAVNFGLWIEIVACDDYGGCVGGAAALGGDAAGVRAGEAI